MIKGKIDRVEEKKDKAKTKILIDYKSSKIVGLNTELQSAQILIYLWLLKINKINISKAGYLCITNKESKWLEVDKIKAEELVKKISLALTEIEKGHPIKPIAAKSGQICKSCSVRAVCRKDEWMLYKSIL